MAIWAIVPVKPLRRGKSRLSAVMDRENRLALNRCLLQNTLETLTAIEQIEQVLVISRDPQVLALARSYQARTIQETGNPQLNQALERATLFAKRHAVHGIYIVPADLPLINSYDIQKMLNMADSSPGVIIAPDRHRKGTNVLYVSPPGAISYKFGEDSFQHHCENAQNEGINMQIAEIPALALDLDVPEDLQLIRQQMQYLKFDHLPQQLLGEKSLKSIDKPDLDYQLHTHPCFDHLIEQEIGGKNAGKNE